MIFGTEQLILPEQMPEVQQNHGTEKNGRDQTSSLVHCVRGSWGFALAVKTETKKMQYLSLLCNLSFKGPCSFQQRTHIFFTIPLVIEVFEEDLLILDMLSKFQFQINLGLPTCISAYSNNILIFIPGGWSLLPPHISPAYVWVLTAVPCSSMQVSSLFSLTSCHWECLVGTSWASCT